MLIKMGPKMPPDYNCNCNCNCIYRACFEGQNGA